jgi:hypothetical protein
VTEYSDAAQHAIRRARQYYRRVIVNAPAPVAEQLLAAGLIERGWVMDAAGRVAWPLSETGRRLHDQLTGKSTDATYKTVERLLGPVRADES